MVLQSLRIQVARNDTEGCCFQIPAWNPAHHPKDLVPGSVRSKDGVEGRGCRTGKDRGMIWEEGRDGSQVPRPSWVIEGGLWARTTVLNLCVSVVSAGRGVLICAPGCVLALGSGLWGSG